MNALGWIVKGGVLMTAIALVGSVTLVLRPATLRKLLLPLVAFAAGNFLYIGAADLVPEVSRHGDPRANLVHLAAFLVGVVLLLFAKLTVSG